MGANRKRYDSETNKNSAVIAEEWEHNASICGRNGVNELHVTGIVSGNGIPREVISVDEVF